MISRHPLTLPCCLSTNSLSDRFLPCRLFQRIRPTCIDSELSSSASSNASIFHASAFEVSLDELNDSLVFYILPQQLKQNFANDRVFDTVELFLQGLIQKGEAIRRLHFEQPKFQIALRTQEAIDKYLHFQGSKSLASKKIRRDIVRV